MVRHHRPKDRANREVTAVIGPLPLQQPPEWTKQAHCLDHPEYGPDTWFETGWETLAAEVCHGSYREGRPCPVRKQCLLYAMENDIKTGVWGGLYRKPLVELVDAAAAQRKTDKLLAKLEAQSRCDRGHRLTPDNVTPKGKCLTCVKDEAVFWRRRNELVRQGELPAEPKAKGRPKTVFGSGGVHTRDRVVS